MNTLNLLIALRDNIMPWLITCIVLWVVSLVFLIVLDRAKFKYWRRFFILMIVLNTIGVIYFVFEYYNAPF